MKNGHVQKNVLANAKSTCLGKYYWKTSFVQKCSISLGQCSIICLRVARSNTAYGSLHYIPSNVRVNHINNFFCQNI